MLVWNRAGNILQSDTGLGRSSWRFSFLGGNRVHLGGSTLSVEDHYLHINGTIFFFGGGSSHFFFWGGGGERLPQNRPPGSPAG